MVTIQLKITNSKILPIGPGYPHANDYNPLPRIFNYGLKIKLWALKTKPKIRNIYHAQCFFFTSVRGISFIKYYENAPA